MFLTPSAALKLLGFFLYFICSHRKEKHGKICLFTHEQFTYLFILLFQWQVIFFPRFHRRRTHSQSNNKPKKREIIIKNEKKLYYSMCNYTYHSIKVDNVHDFVTAFESSGAPNETKRTINPST
jgi:hypothetical protein